MGKRRSEDEHVPGYYDEPSHLAGTVRARMSVGHRAKQFAPFEAVTGLGRALREKQRELEEKAEGK